jgi:hypothetical protein
VEFVPCFEALRFGWSLLIILIYFVIFWATSISFLIYEFVCPVLRLHFQHIYEAAINQVLSTPLQASCLVANLQPRRDMKMLLWFSC